MMTFSSPSFAYFSYFRCLKCLLYNVAPVLSFSQAYEAVNVDHYVTVTYT